MPHGIFLSVFLVCTTPPLLFLILGNVPLDKSLFLVLLTPIELPEYTIRIYLHTPPIIQTTNFPFCPFLDLLVRHHLVMSTNLALLVVILGQTQFRATN